MLMLAAVAWVLALWMCKHLLAVPPPPTAVDEQECRPRPRRLWPLVIFLALTGAVAAVVLWWLCRRALAAQEKRESALAGYYGEEAAAAAGKTTSMASPTTESSSGAADAAGASSGTARSSVPRGSQIPPLASTGP
jgi:hypothetical protein